MSSNPPTDPDARLRQITGRLTVLADEQESPGLAGTIRALATEVDQVARTLDYAKYQQIERLEATIARQNDWIRRHR